MPNKFLILILSLLNLAISSRGQTKTGKHILSETNARKELKVALTDKTIHNVINTKFLIIKDKEIAINVVEPILLSIYGNDNVIKQRPYKAYLIDSYWVISGTLAQDYLGGTFLIIVDATNSRIIRLTHGK